MFWRGSGEAMDSARWNRLQGLFDGALAVPADQRDAYLQQQCAGDESLRRDVTELLDAHVSADGLWQMPPSWVSSSPSVSSGAVLLEAGQAIGPHRIIEKIGAGAMGVVYKAFDSRLQRPVTLKFLSNHLHTDEQAKQRFMVEARAASRLDHPNICVIHDIGETPEGRMYITMPFYEGESLVARLSRALMPASEAIETAMQICEGLSSAHQHDIVHRDINPANIMITPDGLVKILDFGVAKIADVKLTGTGLGIGTPSYMAPEQLNGEDVDARADIWALGATLYEMLTGEAAFSGRNLQQVLKSVLDESYDPVAALPAKSMPALCSVLRNALQRNRDLRYSDIAGMLGDLDRVRTGGRISGAGAANHSTGKDHAEADDYQWNEEYLDSVVEILLPWLGPITPKLVSRYARVSGTLDDLVMRLADVLPDKASRKAVREQIMAKAAMYGNAADQLAQGRGDTSESFELSPAQLAALEKKLLPHVGPIAPALIRRTACNVTSWRQLCDQLCNYLDSEQEKAEFLGDVSNIYSNRR